MKNKKLAILATVFFAFTTAAALAGCKKTETPPLSYEVTLEKETLMLTVGDEASLVADFTKHEGATLSYTSSDEGVVTVDEYGRLLAIREGTATITARYGEATDTCLVTVSMNGMLPLLQMPNLSAYEITMNKSSELDLSGTVLFNGKTYEDVTLTYAVSDPTVGKVENGIFKPLATGTTEISVAGTWRGAPVTALENVITVSVVPELLFMINGGVSEITLYTQTDIVAPFEVTAEVDGVALETSVEITDGAQYVKYDGNKKTVTSRGLTGEAVLTVSYELNGKTVQRKVPVHVEPTVYEYAKLVENFSAIHGDTVTGKTLQGILGGNILSACDEEGNALEVKDNKLYGIKTSDSGKFQTTVTLYGATHGYKVNLEGYSGVFAKASDFEVFNVNASYGYAIDEEGNQATSKSYQPIDKSKPIQKWEGYYVLANNIDASEYEHENNGVALATRGIQSGGYEYGFFGTFDGRGYTVKGMSLGSHGLFGYVVNATVKNVAFADVTLRAEEYAATLAAWIIDSTVSNVYVSIANEGTLSKAGSAFACGVNTSFVNNCIVETKATFGYKNDLKTKGSFTYLNKERSDGDEEQSSFVDVFVISSEVLGRYIYKSTKYYLQAENETLDLEEGFTAYTFAGVKRYATLADMQEAGNNYSRFSADFWTTESGMPVWKSLNGKYPSEEELIPEESTEKETVGSFDTDWL